MKKLIFLALVFLTLTMGCGREAPIRENTIHQTGAPDVPDQGSVQSAELEPDFSELETIDEGLSTTDLDAIDEELDFEI